MGIAELQHCFVDAMISRLTMIKLFAVAVTTIIFTTLAHDAHAVLSPDVLLRQYIKSMKAKELTLYERALVQALTSMDTDVAAQAQPVLRATTGSDSNRNKTYVMHPITFSIASKHVQETVQPKGKVMSTVVPGDWSTYAYLPRNEHTPQQLAQLERDYYVDMQRSFFGLTWKKAGWDCLRHVELLASGCLPLFTDIADAPRGVLALYPKRVLKLLLDFPGVANLTGVPGRSSIKAEERVVVDIKEEQINLPLYAVAVNSLLEFTRNRLTTETVAAHILSRMEVPIVRPRRWYDSGDSDGGYSSRAARRRRRWRCSSTVQGSSADAVPLAFKSRPGSPASLARSDSRAAVAISSAHSDDMSLSRRFRAMHPACQPPPPTRVLFLSLQKQDVDYMTDTLLHGFKALLGDANVVDYHRRSVLYNSPATLLERQWAPKRSSLYGSGFSYAHSLLFTLEPSDGDGDIDQDKYEELLRMDIAAHAFDVIVLGLVHRGQPPLLKEVCSSFPRERVAAVHGHDRPPTDEELEMYDACAKYQFVREAY